MKLNWQACEKGGQCIQPFTGPTLYNKEIEIASESKIISENEAIFTEANKFSQKKLPKDGPSMLLKLQKLPRSLR